MIVLNAGTFGWEFAHASKEPEPETKGLKRSLFAEMQQCRVINKGNETN